ncbi:MAG TPA: hypothetical protein VGK61_04440 [Planctomycetota bacterium]
MRLLPVLVPLALIGAAGAARAQEARPPAQEGELKVDHAVIWVEKGKRVAFLQGVTMTGVRLQDKDGTLRADRMIVWSDLQGAQEGWAQLGLSSIRQMYAEGNVTFTRQDVKTKKTETLRFERFYFDAATRRGYFFDLRADQRSGPDDRMAVTLRAKELLLTVEGTTEAFEAVRSATLGLPGITPPGEGTMKAYDVTISTCTFGAPHYSVALNEADFDWKWPQDPKEAKGPFALLLGKPEDLRVGGNWATVYFWGVPIFFWPSFSVHLAAVSALPLERIQGGRTNRFGLSVESDWGLKLSKGFVDRFNPWSDGNDKDDDKDWGKLRWEVDWRQTRGWAGGIDPSWRWGDYEGYLDTYYLRDRGPDPDNDFDARFLPLIRADRGRARLFHRQALSGNVRLEFESSWLSDRNVLEEFFEKEFKEGKEQETVAYLRVLEKNRAAYLETRYRINNFQTQVEYLPKAKAFLFDQPAVTGPIGSLTFSQELEVVNLRQRFDDALGLPSPSTWRLDSLTSWVVALPLGPLSLSPFAEARVTGYQDALNGDPADRFLATAGLRAATDIVGVHDFRWELVGLNRLRHIIHLEARAAAAFSNTLAPSGLFQYDPTDGFDDFQEFSFEMRHRFQTKVIDGESFRTLDFLEVGAEIEYYPDAPRDTVGFRASNFSYPFNWITLAPHDATGVFEERDWSNLHWDAVLRTAGNFLEARATGEYNPVHRQEEAREYLVTVRPREGLALALGQVFVFDVTNAFTVGARWNLTDKWRVTADAQFDFKTNDFISRKGSLIRDFHDFQLEVVFEEDVGRDERRFYVTFVPTFMRTSK